jgi:HEAT repeat protein
MSLIDRLADSDPEVREDALISLSVKVEPTDQELRALAALLRDDSQRIREEAARTLQGGAMIDWGTDRVASVLPAELLLPALGDRSAEVRQHVLWVLRHYPADDRIRAAARALLGDPICVIRVRAAAVLWALTRDQAAVRPVVDAAICSGDRDGVVYGCQLLMEFGPAAGDVVPLVWGYLRHPDAGVRVNAAYALFKCCRDKQVLAEAAAILEASLADARAPDPLLRYVAYKLRQAAAAEPPLHPTAAE